MPDELAYLNGRILPADEVRVSVFDAGLMHGAGLFETMRCYGGTVMALGEHVRRLTDSAATLDLSLSVSAASLQRAVADFVQGANLRDARIRLTVTAGSVPRPGEESPPIAGPTIVITASPVLGYPPELYRDGMRVCICPYKQNRHCPTAGHKTLGYLPRLMALRHAAERRCNEALWFTTENRLAEGSVSNVFIVRDGAVITPPPDTPVLPGVVRRAVLELCEQAAIPARQEAIVIDDLLAATEVFLTGSVLEVMPVTAVEKHVVGDGRPGEITRRIADLYQERVRRETGGESPAQ